MKCPSHRPMNSKPRDRVESQALDPKIRCIQMPSQAVRAHPKTRREGATGVFFDLFDGRFSDGDRRRAASFLRDQLHLAEMDQDNLPKLDDLHAWMQGGVESVGALHRSYLDRRLAGGPREYFRSRGHALYFLRSVAPTKLVDGAWLYGLLSRWQDPRFLTLIQTYLEELGEGSPAKNHVVLYKKLLAAEGCDYWENLSDEHFVQGAIQLALAYRAEQFLPELIGYNLGYEQLPLHLLITSYELRELGIDPYYFTLHVTVDNADSGHARKAVDAISDTMPKFGDAEDFYRRVQNGYRLNSLGVGTLAVIRDFSLDREVTSIVARKGMIGRHEHSDYHKISGRTVNEWLAHPEEAWDFLIALEQNGWIKRNQDPEHSRFWKMIVGEKAPMFGVFTGYEREIIYEWIAGEFDYGLSARKSSLACDLKRCLQESHPAPKQAGSDFDTDMEALRTSFSGLKGDEAMERMIALMSPARHHSPAGLEATRFFCDMLK